MPTFADRVTLGRTGLSVSRIGLGASFGAPRRAYEEAFDRGVNYFYWGSLRKAPMGDALRSLARTRREDLVIVLQTYSRLGWYSKRSIENALHDLGVDTADVLLLGWFNEPPPARVRDAVLDLQRRGLARHLALSSHNRSLFRDLLVDAPEYAIWHLRYNASHRGAEREVFPTFAEQPRFERPGIVSYTNTRWGHLCDPARTPAGERTPTGTDCYRFALTCPHVDIAIAGPDSEDHMRQALATLESGPMTEDELAWMKRVGDHVYGRDPTSRVRDGVRARAT